ncbi:hypothetical protein Rruber_05456 (plasmid) [Rhodococcus ruber]
MHAKDLAGAVLRVHYRTVRWPFVVIEHQLLPAVLEDDAPARLAYQRVLIECDQVAARVLHDVAVARAVDRLSRRHAATRYAIARRQRGKDRHSAAILERHRSVFLERQRRTRTATSP